NNIFNASAGQGVVYDSGTNYWNTSYDCTGTNIIGGDCIGGNFYSNYTGADDGSGATYPHNIAGDGIGDNPPNYSVYGGSNWDYLPLTNNQTLCFYADTSNTVYTLTRNLYGNKSDGNCITIVDWTTNVTIDCNGYNITGWGVGKGILSAYSSHNTIKNCNIRNYTYAMDLRVGQNISVFNNNITNNTNGIALIVDIKHSRLYNNYFYDNTGSSFYMVYGCDNVSFYNNTIEKSGGWAISLRDTTTNSRIENNTIFDGNSVGIRLYPSDTLNNTIKGNSIYNQGGEGIYLSSGTNNNTILDNIVYNTTNYQIAISSSSDNLIYNNIFNASAGQGVVYDSGTNYWNTSYDCTGTNIIGGDCIGGNFYSNYTGVDDGSGATYPHNIYGDGIGDNPPNYSIYGGSNWDYLPLTNNITYARCFYANISNTVYTLSGNLYGNKSDRICITINASNITIDCNGYNITGNHSLTENTIGIGSYVGWENVTIQGCHVSNYTYGLYAYSFNNTLIDELNSIRNHFGIYLNQTTNSNITNSKIEVYNETAWSRGIYLVNSSGIRISSSHINRTGLTSAAWAIGIMPCATNDTIIESSNFTDRLTRSIFVSICREVDGTEFQAPTYNLTIKDNHFWDTETVIALWVNYNTSIINNTIEYYRGYGIVSGYLGLPGEYWDLLIENNTIRNATNCLDDPSYSGHMTGIYIDTNSGGWTVRGNRIEYMPTLGIDLDGVGGYSYNMLFENNVFNHTGENDYGAGCDPTPNMGGVYFGGIENSTVQNNIVENFGSSIGINFWQRENQNVLVQNNTVFNGNATGIGGSGTQNNITVRNNTVSFARAGIGFSSTSNSAFYNNTVHDNTKEGIAISNGYNNTLQDNLAYANMYGISLNNVVNHTLLNNNMTNNRYNFYIEGSSVPHFVHNITTDNIVRDTVLDSSDKYIYYYVRNVTGDGLYDNTEPIPTNVGFIGVVNSSDFLVENVSLHNNSHGLLSVLANNVTANNATFYYEYIGAYLLYSSNHNITNLNSSSNGAGGFRLYYSDKNNITDSEIKNNGLFGVDLIYTNNTIVENNQIHNNSYYGFRGYASSYSNRIINNTIGSFHNISIFLNNAPYTLIENNTIYQSNIDGIHLFMNSNCNITNNSITSNTQYGINLNYQSSNNIILYNTITNNGYSGLYILISVNNTIAGNTISDNTQNGIYLFGYANENNITNNTISGNFFNGIRIEAGCSNNLIYNNILNNTYNTYDDGTNYWNYSYCPGGPNIIGGQCIGGNYYSDYDGIDDGSGSPPIHNIAGDGIGDNPDQYAIGGGTNIDYMPLTNNQLGMNCMYINSNTSLLANLVGNKSDRACITFNASNIYLNCSGYNITGNIYDDENKTYAIMTNGFENISIINCPNLTNYSFGIYVNGTKNATINNVTSYKNTDSGIGIVDNSSQIEISNTTLPFNGENGIFINSSSQVNVYSTEIYNNPYSTIFNIGIYSLNSSRILISNASIYNHSAYGILAYNTSHISISDSYSTFNQIAGMYLDAGNNLTMQNSNFSNNTIYGIRLNAFENITGNNITIYGTRGDEAFLADYSYNATISNSSISFNYLNAIRLFTSANFTFNNITANNNTRGIYINDYTNGTRILNSNISFNSDKGVFFTQTTDSNRMENSYICFNTQKDIDNQDGTDNNGSLNTCDTYYQWKDDELPDGCAMTCTSIWHYFYGNITGLILLGTNWTEPKFMSNWTPAIVHMYVFPEGNTISWLELQALGRKTDNTIASSDFEEADVVLGIDPALADSINKTFSIDGTLPIENTTYRVWGRDIANISIANSTDNKNFKTGILWDMSDGGTEFTSADHQDLVFMTNITWDGEGKWGTYDYEIRVPSQFATYNGGAGRVIIYLEVQ
ncbi:MAG: right-handed parallel beta-helix repeat-containing protein, partial [Candidatus Anstonellales archaeon]